MSRLFSEADSRNARIIRRQDLRKVLNKYKSGLSALKQKEPVWEQIMRNLEHLDSKAISKENLRQAVAQVCLENSEVEMSAEQSDALVNLIY
jgi:hypothetical protein